MHYTEYHKSEFLAGEDLYKGPMVVTITKAYGKDVNLGDGKKPYHILEFKEIEQKLIMNVTNDRAIAEIVGDGDDVKWIGVQIELFPHMQTSFGVTKPAVRIRAAAPTKTLEKIQSIKNADQLKLYYNEMDAQEKKHPAILNAIKKRKEELSK